jgi:transposase
MKTKDGRSLDRKTMEEIRIRAVHAVRDDDKSPEDVIEIYGMNRRDIYRWLSAYDAGGDEALLARKAPGKKPKISENQRKRIAHIMHKKTPLSMGYLTKLWTREIVKDIIKKQFGITLSVRTVGDLLKTIGLSFQKPLQRAYQRNPKAIEQWKAVDYPKIKAQALKESAAIFFADESTVRACDRYGSTWGPRGQRPSVPHNSAHLSVSAISAVGAHGKFRFMTVQGTVNGAVFKTFLMRLMHDAKEAIFLILDNCHIHKSKIVNEYVAKLKGKLKIFFLPPYAPELNPDELIWSGLKSSLGKLPPAKSKLQLSTRTSSYLQSIQHLPKKILAVFQSPDTSYAA